ncbi:MAG TPA: phosphatase PAP2 family protein [Bryobacteraceae bacterium]|jgi:acid phosphatase (class A)|nr:phosphatase PAP2 family protein [Bryobacteraceae bacterium]
MKIPWHVTGALFASAIAVGGQPAAPARMPGYLTSSQTSDVVRIVPAAPKTGDARFEADMSIFRSTRSLEGSARWTFAQSDDNLSVSGLLHAFSCSLGLTLTPENAPKLVALINRASADATAASNVIKIRYQHKRPFQIAEADVCVSPEGKEALKRSPDYPSGHTTVSWETGLILSQLAPDDAVDVLARARAFGQSRVACGVHSLGAVEAGWMTATAVFAMQLSSPDFRKDLGAAQSELASLRAAAKAKPPGCEAEAQILSNDPY